jgi:hypothetical protein
MMVMRPILKNTSFDRPVDLAATMAPMMPTGTTSNTAMGVARFRRAARHRNTTKMESPNSNGAGAGPDPAGLPGPIESESGGRSCATILCISAMAAGAVTFAFEPTICMAPKPLKRWTVGGAITR